MFNVIQARYSQCITHKIVNSPLLAAIAFIAIIIERLNACEIYVKTNFSSINFDSNGTDENNNNDAGIAGSRDIGCHFMELYRFNFILNTIQCTLIQSDCTYMTEMMTLYYDGYAENTIAKNVLPKKKTGLFAQCLNRISNSSVNISKFDSQSPHLFCEFIDFV